MLAEMTVLRRSNPLWDWDRLSPRDQEGAWLELEEWVDRTVLTRHGLRVPTDWKRDSQLTAELIRLHELEVYGMSDGIVPSTSEWEAELKRSSSRWA